MKTTKRKIDIACAQETHGMIEKSTKIGKYIIYRSPAKEKKTKVI